MCITMKTVGMGYGNSVAMHTVCCNPLCMYMLTLPYYSSCLVTVSVPLSFLAVYNGVF